jgi:hypothetical protein
MKQIRCFIFFTNDVIMSTINIKFVYCIKWNVYHSTDVYENNLNTDYYTVNKVMVTTVKPF